VHPVLAVHRKCRLRRGGCRRGHTFIVSLVPGGKDNTPPGFRRRVCERLYIVEGDIEAGVISAFALPEWPLGRQKVGFELGELIRDEALGLPAMAGRSLLARRHPDRVIC
jgi:hypothetical protein